MSLYKYLAANHALTFLEQGRVLLSLAERFKDTTLYGMSRGDSQECRKVVSITYYDCLAADDSKRQAIEKFIPGASQMTTLVAERNAYSYKMDSPYYLYCASMEKNNSTLMEAFQSDVCVEIFEPALFAERISSALSPHCHWCGWFNCQYGRRDMEFDDSLVDVPAILIKADRYRYQREIRALWQCLIAPTSETIFVDIPNMRDVARICGAKHSAKSRLSESLVADCIEFL